VLAWNYYYGWYRGTYADLGRLVDTFHVAHPDRPVGISEYGAGGSIFQHEQDPPPRPKSQSKGPWHPEEWQNEVHEDAWLTLKARPYIWGTFVWNMFDFAADHRNEGDTQGRNDKGLVTYDRRTRKDSFFWYQANWTARPMVYITSRRDCTRLDPVTSVKVYSNCESVELWFNGSSQGRRTSADRRFVWGNLRLQPGVNRIYAEGYRGDAVVSDSCGWTLAEGCPYAPPVTAEDREGRQTGADIR
jgi:beta-galactosidase